MVHIRCAFGFTLHNTDLNTVQTLVRTDHYLISYNWPRHDPDYLYSVRMWPTGSIWAMNCVRELRVSSGSFVSKWDRDGISMTG